MKHRLVICCDGTWNRPDQTDRGKVRPSNVAKLALAVSPHGADGVPQEVYYHPGVGTGRWDRLGGGAFGRGLSQRIQHAYRYVVERFEPGDEIFLFGFSRGAYTVRSLAGLIRNCGILQRENVHRIGEAYKLYRQRDPRSDPRQLEATLFRRTYSQETRIRCIGVWDTVGALGIPFGPLRVFNWLAGLRFHDVRLSTWVDNAFQALAIDERRRPFRPAIWQQQPDAGEQRLEQAWFSGVHRNIGGGYEDSGLSDLALRWMWDRVTSCGLALDETRLPDPIRPDAGGTLRDSMTLLYWFLIPMRRTISGTNAAPSFERVHPSVHERLKSVAAYAPPNLRIQRGTAGIP
jgi:uncharacterized protein (DUF2235 family)